MSCWILFILIWFLITENVIADNCGRRSAPKPLINRGEESYLGEWPWHVAIMHRMNLTEENYACGGTIITASYILTAAHCTYPETRERKLQPSEIIILAGISDIRQVEKFSMQKMAVAEIIAHEGYQAATTESDIALLELDGKLNFTHYIKPICLWRDGQDEALILGKVGYTPGWGRNEHVQLPDKLHHAAMSVVARNKCKDDDPVYYSIYLFDWKAFCAGFRNGTSPGAGDSGGGLYVEIGSKWMLRGIVSHGKLNSATRQLDSSEYIVYSDVAYFAPWINNKTTMLNCGRQMALPPLLANRTSRSRLGEWPWHAAVLHRLNQTFHSYICGGTIIGSRYILTSAYCLFNQDRKLLTASEIIIETGITNLKHQESSLQQTAVAKISRNEPDWGNFFVDNDMALLQLVENLMFSQYVQPICLWKDSADEQMIAGKVGYIAGWGTNERNKLSNHLKNAEMLFVSRKQCRDSDPVFYTDFLFDEHHFCAGFYNKTAVIKGYTGGGLYIKIDGRWILRGISSFVKFNRFTQEIELDPPHYVVFTSVPYFFKWINDNTEIESKNTKSIAPDVCGYRKDLLPLLSMNDGSQTRLGEWPWHVAVIYKTSTKYACGGTIIASSYILTTAHCMCQTDGYPLSPEDVLIRTGITNLRQPEHSLQEMEVAKITIHEDFSHAAHGENDIALLKLTEELTFSDNIKPICLWRDRADEVLIVDKVGYIAGWDFDKSHNALDHLTHAEMLIVSRRQCRNSDSSFYTRFLFLGNSFCAGLHNGTFLSKGMTGGGLFIEQKGRWFLRGITSNAKVNVVTGRIDTSSYFVFTDIAFFLPWIRNKTDTVQSFQD